VNQDEDFFRVVHWIHFSAPLSERPLMVFSSGARDSAGRRIGPRVRKAALLAVVDKASWRTALASQNAGWRKTGWSGAWLLERDGESVYPAAGLRRPAPGFAMSVA
jgi:hypothetical protein